MGPESDEAVDDRMNDEGKNYFLEFIVKSIGDLSFLADWQSNRALCFDDDAEFDGSSSPAVAVAVLFY